MLLARLTGGDRRRPMLLALVFGVVLVLVGVTASALVAVTSNGQDALLYRDGLFRKLASSD